MHSSHRKQQEFVANRIADILDTTDVSQWEHVSSIRNPGEIGTTAIYIEDLKKVSGSGGRPGWSDHKVNYPSNWT